MKYRYLALTILTSLLVSAAAAPVSQHHPFSELFPPDQNLNFGGESLEGASSIETGEIVVNGTGSGDFQLRNDQNNNILNYDKSQSLLNVENSDLSVTGGTLDVNSPSTTGRVLDVGGGANFGANVNLTFNSLKGLNNIQTRNNPSYISTSGTGSGEIRIWDTDAGNSIARFLEGGNVEVPNGNIDVSAGQLTVYSGGNSRTALFDSVGSRDNYVQLESGAGVGENYVNEIRYSRRGGVKWSEGFITNSDGTYRIVSGSTVNGAGTDVMRLSSGGDIGIPNGNLDIGSPSEHVGGGLDMSGDVNINSGGILIDDSSNNAVPDSLVLSNDFGGNGNIEGNSIQFTAGGTNYGRIKATGDMAGSSPGVSLSGFGVVKVSDGNLDISGNNVTSSGGEMCIGQYC